MKKISFLLAACALLAACSQQRPLRVEKPDVLASNAASSLDLTAVAATDSATVLSFDVTFPAGRWIRIAESSYIIAGSDTLPLLAASGIVPDSLFVMPESGRHSFDLTFGPVAPDVEKISFSEGPGGWTLAGIDLMDKHRTEPAVPAKILRESDGEVFAKPILEVADTEFEIHIMDYMPQLGSKLKVLILGLGGISFEETVAVSPQGIATFSAPVYGTSNLILSLADFEAYAPAIVVAPGKSVEVYLDPRYTVLASAQRLGKARTDRFVYDNGRYAALNAQMANPENQLIEDIISQPDADLWRLTPEQFTDSLLNVYNTSSAEIDQLLADRQFKQYLKADLTTDLLLGLQSAGNTYIRSFYACYPTFGNNWRDSVPALPADADYERAVKALDISAPELLMLPSYRYVVEEINFKDWNIDSPQAAEVADYYAAFQQADGGEVDPDVLDRLKSFSSPFFAQAVEDHAKVMQEKLNAMSGKIHELPDVDDSELFTAIVDRYKGKVVLVDLWNTWCGPCRRALAANEPLKTGELSDPDIVWVYIADKSSNMGTYSEMINDIAGEHYMVNAEQIAAIRSRFNVDGIPYYILVDREGNAVGHPDFRDHSLLVEGIKSKL